MVSRRLYPTPHHPALGSMIARTHASAVIARTLAAAVLGLLREDRIEIVDGSLRRALGRRARPCTPPSA